mmetsp:Transcript_146744/g.470942  ORF Transcript_146744/g.470942 Transcript_146744/m.470942 type:complete len:215 (+) Transcript_146744:4107-4751(+)
MPRWLRRTCCRPVSGRATPLQLLRRGSGACPGSRRSAWGCHPPLAQHLREALPLPAVRLRMARGPWATDCWTISSVLPPDRLPLLPLLPVLPLLRLSPGLLVAGDEAAAGVPEKGQVTPAARPPRPDMQVRPLAVSRRPRNSRRARISCRRSTAPPPRPTPSVQSLGRRPAPAAARAAGRRGRERREEARSIGSLDLRKDRPSSKSASTRCPPP